MKPSRGTGSLYRQPGSPFWWCAYYQNGLRFRESTKQTSEQKAAEYLRDKIGQITSGEFISPKDRRIKVEQIYKLLTDDYRINDKVSLEGAEQRWEKRLKASFGHLRVGQVTTSLLNDYVKQCQSDGLSNGTINRDLAALKRAFNLAYRSTPRMVREVPVFPHLDEAPPRQGFVEQEQYGKLCKASAGKLWLRAMLATAYTFGFREGELLEMRVNQIDLASKSIRLWRGTTKSKEPRLVKMTQEVCVLLTACVTDKQPDGFVFTRGSNPVLDFRGAWETLCSEAGVAGLLFHDLRRSAVRNMVRRGVPERVAMEISGHKTRSVFDRYNIVNDADLAEAARKIEAGALIHNTAIIQPKPKQEASKEVAVQ